MEGRFLLCVIGALLPSWVDAASLNVFAAASLSEALEEIGRTYEAASCDTLRFNFAASSTLALQIKQGAPADVFFSADEAKMDRLQKAGLVDTATRRSLLANTLVIVVNSELGAHVMEPADLAKPGFGRIALAEPETVPAGIYAKEYLQKSGLWEKIAHRVVPTENVRACLAAVESGNVDVGIVYKTDALISKKIRIACEIPAGEGPKISYPLAAMKESRVPDAAHGFVGYVSSSAALSVFSKYGFLPLH